MKKLFGTVTGKKISILGFAFKANTNDTRESAAITICKDLLEEGANLIINDPRVNSEQIEKDLGFKKNSKLTELNNEALEGTWTYQKDLYEAIKGTDAILVLTEWSEYAEIEWGKVSNIMRKPAWIFDARSIINVNKVKNWI